MPELPEVQTIVNDLQLVLKGKHILSIKVAKPALLRSPRLLFYNKVQGSTIKMVSRRAKLLLFNLSSGYTLLIHLKMTGQLVWQSKQGQLKAGGHSIVGVTKVPNKYTYITINLSDGSKLYYNDVRQFGYFKVVPTAEVKQELSLLGPEPLSVNFRASSLSQQLSRRGRTTIKAALLNQQVIAGLGNIYVDESLYSAKIRPTRRVSSLKEEEVSRLWRSIRQVLTRAVLARGTSFSNYRDAHGRPGGYWSRRLVYGRGGEPCRRCRRPIKRIVTAGRGTHYCPHCQK